MNDVKNSGTKAGFYESPAWRAFGLGHPGGKQATVSLVEAAGLKPGARVLDLCCGAGDSCGCLIELGMTPTGADSSEKALAAAKERFGDSLFIHSKSDSLPFESGFFDAVLCECALSLMGEKLKETLAEVSRVLSGGGLFLVSDLFSKTPGTSVFMPEEWRKAFQSAGFSEQFYEDRTKDLKAFVARWLWENEKPFPFCPGEGAQKPGLKAMGYFQAVYKKNCL